jgi:hypothetical protein
MSVTSVGTPADAETRQAIQDVILRLDQAQAQAIATNDHNVMAATATADFLALQVSTNQKLMASGVVAVKLLSMEWGPITVNGNSANATVYETWMTTFDDGAVVQSRDLNVYTLVNDNARGWLVQADEHPDAR